LKTTLTVTPLPGLGVGLLSEAIIDASLDDRAETKLIEKPTITMKVIMDAILSVFNVSLNLHLVLIVSIYNFSKI